MNIYETLDWIRKNDTSTGHHRAKTAEFLNKQYMSGRISSEDLFYMYKELQIGVIENVPYHSYFSKIK